MAWEWKVLLNEEEHAKFLSMRSRVPTVDLDAHDPEPSVLMLVTRAQCEHHGVFPVLQAGGSLVLALADPANDSAVREIAESTGHAIDPVIATEGSIRRAIARNDGPST